MKSLGTPTISLAKESRPEGERERKGEERKKKGGRKEGEKKEKQEDYDSGGDIGSINRQINYAMFASPTQ